MRAHRTSAARVASAVICCTIGLLLIACSPATSVTAQTASPTPSATSTPTLFTPPTPQPTATALGANPCESSSNPNTESILSARGIPTPDGAIVVDQGDQAMDGVTASADFELTGICAKGSSPDAVWEFYAARMPAAGWTQSATIPQPADPSAPCSGKYCWTKDAGNGTTLVISFQNMQPKGSDTEFTLVYESYSKSS